MRRSLILLALVGLHAGPAAAQAVLPVPAVTIYPREVIRDDMIEEQEIAARAVGGRSGARAQRGQRSDGLGRGAAGRLGARGQRLMVRLFLAVLFLLVLTGAE